jgi:hypothetical protein
VTGRVVELEGYQRALERFRRALDSVSGQVREMTPEELEAVTMTKAKAKAKAKTASGPGQLVAFRLSLELLERVDAYAAKMTEQVPGVTFTRTDAVRALLSKALTEE